MTDAVEDRELADDVVGVASARLRALGLAPDRRRHALRLLGVLGAVADGEHRIRRPVPDVAHEFGLPPESSTTALDDLLDVGVARHDGDMIVLGGAEPAAHGAIRLQDFLAVADELEQQRGRHRSPAVFRPAAALVAVAALIAVVLLAPGMTGNRSAPVSSTGRDAPVTSSTDGPSTPGEPDRRPTTSTVTLPGHTGPSAPTTPTTPTAAPRGVPPAPSCPPGPPLLEIVEARPDVEGHLAVRGLARNITGEELEIESFTVQVTVAGRDVRTPSAGSLLVPAQSAVPWELTVPVVGAEVTDLAATLGDWQWRSPTCSDP